MNENDISKKIDEVHKELRKYPNVLNINIGTKWTEDKDTGETCIVVYVVKKKPTLMLSINELIPKEIEGIKTDVVELSTSDFEIGETEPSKHKPSIQRKIAGGVILG